MDYLSFCLIHVHYFQKYCHLREYGSGNPGFQDLEEVHKHNNKSYDAKIRNRSRVLYLGMFYKFTTGMDPDAAFYFGCAQKHK